MKTWNDNGEGESSGGVGQVMNSGSGGGQLKPKVESFTGKGVSLGGEKK